MESIIKKVREKICLSITINATDLFMDLLTRFIRGFGHQKCSNVTPPVECPKAVILIQDDDNQNYTDH